MGTTIRAIQTRYAGCHFRSRLEARWAVLFDHLGIAWEYEPQGFEIKNFDTDEGWRYLPDFYLPDTKTWVEVKGSNDQITDDYRTMLAHAIDWGGQLPDVGDSVGSTRGLLILGPIPRVEPGKGMPVHQALQHQEGGWTSFFSLGEVGVACEIDGSRHHSLAFSCWDPPTIYLAPSPLPNWHASRYQAEAYLAARSARFEHGERAPW